MFFDPIVQSQKALELWTKATQEQLARMAELARNVDATTEQVNTRTREAIDESARLMKASLEYATNLGAEWRRISLDLAGQAVAAAPKSATSGS
jgi:hypothetical protein